MTFVRNIEPFTIYPEGFPRVVRRGDILQTDDPAYRGREHLFEPIEEHAAREIARQKGEGTLPVTTPLEQMTARPGEVRHVQIPRPDDSDTDAEQYKCDRDGCDFTSASERGLKIHKRSHDQE